LAFAQDEHYGDIASPYGTPRGKYDLKKQGNLIERGLEISDAMTPAKPSLWEKSWHHCKMISHPIAHGNRMALLFLLTLDFLIQNITFNKK
jgi:hypothetical protein